MLPSQTPRWPAVPPDGSGPVSYRAVYVLAGLAAPCWVAAAWGGIQMAEGRDLPEGMLSLFGFLWLAFFEMFALLFQLTAAWELRRRNSPRAALVTVLIAVAGVVASIVLLFWVATSAKPYGT
ncbi:hypothetical protein [Micromonospora sp. MH99]|uniref:hypothetical protein n=1 Tax=unclassified Micromonospora TaxID=2617518 RepID=UPI001F1F6F9D|nr:hypothetical protein [Micromonospora sp. MH99]MCF0096442.1 hypothetical protein [Micromonospora sp. MH99]